MTERTFSRREQRQLLKAMESVVLTEFPNPERRGCPGSDVLRLIAKKELPMRDPVHEHVGSCSPCFQELCELRAGIRGKRTRKAAGAATAVLLAMLIGYYALQSPPVTTRTETPAAPPSDSVSPGVPTRAEEAAVPPSEPVPGDVATRTDTPTVAVAESASIDLRDFQTTRSAQPDSANQPTAPRVPRRMLALTIYLPVGAMEGEYEVQIEGSRQAALAAGSGNAVIEAGITTLRINLDTTSIPAGEYRLQLRPKGLSWRQYPIVIQ